VATAGRGPARRLRGSPGALPARGAGPTATARGGVEPPAAPALAVPAGAGS
jgi:hypothetical protein